MALTQTHQITMQAYNVKQINKIVDCLNTQYIIIGGDFNLVMDKDFDSIEFEQ